MAKINCLVENCIYNNSRLCNKRVVSVGGFIARTKTNTFCESYIEGNDYESEFAIMNDEIDIWCDAMECIHLKLGRCQKEVINVGGKNVHLASQTECLSFKNKA